MGMITSYQPTSDSELKDFLCLDDVEGSKEDEDSEIRNIDRVWNAPRFSLTGKSASESIENDLISEAIVGQFNISEEDIGGLVPGTRSNRVKGAAGALQKIDLEEYIDKFNTGSFAEGDIYPNIWEYEDEADEIKDDLRISFESLRKSYAKVAE